MLVKCIDNSSFSDQLTEDRMYIVLCATPSSYLVLNDNSIAKWYGTSKFFHN